MMMQDEMRIERREYMQQLINLKDKRVIKVVTGIRRCGKSTLLGQFAMWLEREGIRKEQIITVNFESERFKHIVTGDDLTAYLSERIFKGGRTYIFLDEIQEVKGFERSVNSLTVDYDVDVYLTGSNAHMLSSDLATYLSGRYVEIKMYPLSFKEYMGVQGEQADARKSFLEYLKYGGFPFLANENNEQLITQYLDGIYNTVVFKDVVQRNSIKDTALLNKIIHFAFSAMGSLMSASSIEKAIKNDERGVGNVTIERYLDALCDAHILSKAVRFDIKGKQYFKTLNKYYVADLGMRNHVLGYRQTDVGHALENVVYYELLRRGYKVDIGVAGNYEIDFVARNKQGVRYYQVAWTVNSNEETLKRECRPFDSINDHNPKYLITMDDDFVNSINGINKVNAVDFLLEF